VSYNKIKVVSNETIRRRLVKYIYVMLRPIKVKGSSMGCLPSHIRIMLILIKVQLMTEYFSRLTILIFEFLIVKKINAAKANPKAINPPTLLGIDRSTA